MTDPPDQLSAPIEAALRQYAGLVQGVGRRHGLDASDLDEVMQEVRIRLWRALGAGERIEQMRPLYVRRAAVSAAIDVIRRHRGRKEEPMALDEMRILAPQSRDRPDTTTERGELGQMLARAIETLGATRQPVVRMYLAGYSSDEIAQVLGWTEAKARNLLYRGLTDLRGKLLAGGLTLEAMG